MALRALAGARHGAKPQTTAGAGAGKAGDGAAERKYRNPAASDADEAGAPGAVGAAKAVKKPREIQVTMKILSVSSVSNVEQRFGADFIVVLRWNDPKLIGKKNADIDWDECWHPRVSVKNAVELTKIDDSASRRLEDSSTGLVRDSARYRGSLSEYLELEEFPFDHQDLTIVLSTTRPNTDVVFVSPPSDRVRVSRFLLPEWEMRPPKWEVVTSDPADSTSGRVYSELMVKLQARRLYGSYIWNVGLVVGMIVSLCFLTFCVDVMEVADRLTTTLTLLLTAVAFKFVVGESLPKIAYLTLMDKYMLVAFTFLYAIAIENGVVTLFPITENEDGTVNDLPRKVDRYFIWVASGLWVLYNLGVLYFVYGIHRKHREHDLQEARDIEERAKREQTARHEQLSARARAKLAEATAAAAAHLVVQAQATAATVASITTGPNGGADANGGSSALANTGLAVQLALVPQLLASVQRTNEAAAAAANAEVAAGSLDGDADQRAPPAGAHSGAGPSSAPQQQPAPAAAVTPVFAIATEPAVVIAPASQAAQWADAPPTALPASLMPPAVELGPLPGAAASAPVAAAAVAPTP